MSKAILASTLAGLLVLATSAAPVSSRPANADETLDELDAHIQARFLRADTRFGITRIAPRGDHHLAVRRFRPENPAEADTIATLDRAGLQVVIYLAGRALLTMPPGTHAADDALQADTSAATAPASPAWLTLRRVLEGPVAVSPSKPLPDLPRPPPPGRLLDDARRAFALFSDGQRTHTFAREGWAMTARPVRASRERCLDCHRFQYNGAGSALVVGDVLGVVLYGQQPLETR